MALTPTQVTELNVAKESGATDSLISVASVGDTIEFTNLAPGQIYYYDNGELSLSGQRKLGIAISTTELLIQ